MLAHSLPSDLPVIADSAAAAPAFPAAPISSAELLQFPVAVALAAFLGVAAATR